jgi:hypothetical protein
MGYIILGSGGGVFHEGGSPRRRGWGRLQATRFRRRQAEGKRAQTGLLLKVLRRTRRAPEPCRWAVLSSACIRKNLRVKI